MNKTKIVTVGIVVLFAVLTVSTASAAHATFFFDPQNTSVPEGYCNTREVKLMINITTDTPMDKVKGGQVGIRYNPSCMNITDHPVYGEWPGWGPNMDPWMSSWNAYPICCGDAGGMRYDMVMYGFDGSKEGIQHIATFTVHCNSTEYCETPMLFGYGKSGGQPCPIEVITRDDRNLYPDNVTFENGTFTCGTPAETYTISGYAKTEGDDPATRVNITNTDKPDAVDDRPADYIGLDGFYNLTLDVTGEVAANDVLQITACRDTGNNESNCNVTNHEVIEISGEENVNLTLNHFCRNYLTFPYRTWEESNWSGPAVMQMLVDHYRPLEPLQSYLNETGIAHNQVCNADLLFVDPSGMRWTLNYILHNISSYGGGNYANYGIGSYTDINNTLHYMCKWHYLGPGAAPTYGDYSNWMVVRGIHTDMKPTFAQDSYIIYGFWMNDPYNKTLEGAGGIGENTYKSVEQWKSEYHKMLNVNEADSYNGTYVAVCEPPEDDDVEVTLAKPKPRLAEAITPMLAEEPMMLYGVKQLALEKVVKDDELLKVVKAAIDGVNEELVPYDSGFAAVFAKTVPGQPMLVSSENGDYYVVPFNVPVEVKQTKKMPVEIERPEISGLKKLERMKRVAEKIELKPIPIEPIRVEKTLVVVIVDATDGSFKEASWVENPEKYLPVSKIEAMKLALGEVLDELHVVAKKDARDLEVIQTRPTIELVYVDASPYYPDWKVTVNGKVFYVSQDGTVSN
ncbi:hypothetical protein C5S31_05110 [ANME-1 cluster archaeon GoMg2]|nr:hypothetical protein [ANME-1 cluster archaeon GoMg2]